MNQNRISSRLKTLVIVCILSLIIFVIPVIAAKKILTENTPNNGEQIIKLNLISQIRQKVTTDAGSMFVNLTPEAVKIGLPDARLYGSIRQEELADKSTRMYISWHSLGIPTAQGEPLRDSLDSPLRSQIRTEADKIEPGEIITAQGDLDGLIATFLDLKEQLKKEAPKHVLEEEDEEDEEESGSLSPDSGGTSAAGGDFGQDLDSPSDFTTNLLTSQWEDCDPRVAQEEGKVYRQARQIEVGEDGETVSTGQCVDHGGTVEIQKAYGDPCSIIYDYENRKAYEQYKEWADVDGKTIAVTNCSNDFKRSYEIYAKKDDCGVRHDFEAGRSIVQEKLYYQNNTGEETEITECQDSSKAYAHFLTEATCSPFIDKVNQTVTIYKRTAYRLDDGTLAYASDCRAVDGGTKQLYEAYCDQKYEHDFTVGQSFYRTRDYYLDENNEPLYLTECTRSTAASFPHIYNTSDCGVVHDDDALRSVQYTSTNIDTPEGRIEISPCQDNGTTVPYAFVGVQNREKVFTSSGSWTVPNGVTSVSVFLVAGGQPGGASGGSNAANGRDGGGVVGGMGAPYVVWQSTVNMGDGGPQTVTKYAAGAGGGGASGEQITQTLSVIPGETMTVTIGAAGQNTRFGNITARSTHGSGQGGNGIGADTGGRGAPGYGTKKLTSDIRHNNKTVGYGGLGYGAGGAGAAHNGSLGGYPYIAGGDGAPGYAKISWSVNEYKRVDDSIYIQE